MLKIIYDKLILQIGIEKYILMNSLIVFIMIMFIKIELLKLKLILNDRIILILIKWN